jgi:cytochrome c553
MKTFQLLVLGLVLLAIASGCRRGMFDQSKYRPYEASSFFEDGTVSRPLVAHTIARGHLEADEHLYRGQSGTNLVETFPFPVTRAVLERGRERYDIYCAVCHGRTGEANGMVVQRGFPVPPSFHLERLRDAPVGHFYQVITHGYGVMYPYASRIDVADRWAVAAYIRALQLSQNAKLQDLSQVDRAKLEGAR